jgi:hypothetical protein
MGAALALVAGVSSNASANTVRDLTTAGSTTTNTSASGDTFIVNQITPQSTGTGFIDSFLRIQQTGSERGYNTNTNQVLDNKDGNFTHSILLSDLAVQTVGGVEYYMFILDINQTGPNPLLSLNQVQIYANAGDPGAGCVAGLDEASAGNFANLTTGCGTEVFTMSNNTVGTDYELQLNYALNAGSGSGDYQFLIAKSAFAGIPLTSNIILFSQFGNPNGAYSSNDGFEEWWALRGTAGGTPPVPEPASLLLFGMGLGLVARHARRMRARA